MSNGTLSTIFKVGHRFRVFISFDPASYFADPHAMLGLETRWWPKVPRRMSDSELADYRRGRDAFIGEIAVAIGGNVLSVEPNTRRIAVARGRREDE